MPEPSSSRTLAERRKRQLEINLGMQTLKCFRSVRHVAQTHRVDGPHANFPAKLLARADHFLFQPAIAAQQITHAPVVDLASSRQLERAFRSINQTNTKRLLQMLHCLTDRTLGHIGDRRSFGKAVLVGDGAEKFEGAEVQGDRLSGEKPRAALATLILPIAGEKGTNGR